MSDVRPEVAAAVRDVLRDVGLTDVRLSLAGEQVEVWTEAGHLTIWHDDLSHGVDLVTHVADQLQNDAHMWRQDGWGEPFPPCPGHGHPANAHDLAGEAWWMCPATDQPVGRVGELGGHHA